MLWSTEFCPFCCMSGGKHNEVLVQSPTIDCFNEWWEEQLEPLINKSMHYFKFLAFKSVKKFRIDNKVESRQCRRQFKSVYGEEEMMKTKICPLIKIYQYHKTVCPFQRISQELTLEQLLPSVKKNEISDAIYLLLLSQSRL